MSAGPALSRWLGLKDVVRAGWARAGHPEPESVADHSWGVALLALQLAPPGLDLGKLLAYAIVHDLAEVLVGDLTPTDGVPPVEKRRREQAAIEKLSGELPGLGAFAQAYLDDDGPERRFVHELDRLEMAIQAARTAHLIDPAPFLRSARASIRTPALVAILDDLAPEA